MKTILLVGGCGSGKTWVMLQLIQKFKLDVQAKVGMVGFRRNDKLIVPGVYDGSTFQGTDKLSMAVMRDVPAFLELMKKYKYCVFEGDRFTNKNLIAVAKPYIIKILDDGAKGRLKRGSSQTERQLKSIATRVANVVSDCEVSDSLQAFKKICKLVG